jgi:hypothetical protein
MTKTVVERTEFGFEIIAEAMEMLVVIYNTISRDELDEPDETYVSLPASKVCEALEMLFAYVEDNEDINIQELMESTSMELSSTVALMDDGEEPKIH